MSSQEVTYSNSRVFESSSEPQNPVRPSGTQGPRETGNKVALGILCLLLMTATSVWLTYIFQYHQEKHKLQKTLDNLYYNYSTLQNDCNLKEAKLRNKSRECDALKDQLNFFAREQNRCFGESKTVLDCSQYGGKCAEGRWFCCGIKCYYITMENKHWNGCKKTCQDCSLSLLKIDDDSEMRFLQLQLSSKSYWIGLAYDSKRKKWTWIDNGPSKLIVCARMHKARSNQRLKMM